MYRIRDKGTLYRILGPDDSEKPTFWSIRLKNRKLIQVNILKLFALNTESVKTRTNLKFKTTTKKIQFKNAIHVLYFFITSNDIK